MILARRPRSVKKDRFWHIAALLLIAALTAALAALAGRVSGHEVVAVGTEADRLYITDGFYDPERSADLGLYRWSAGYAILTLPNWGPGPIDVRMSGVGAGGATTEAVLTVAGGTPGRAPVTPGRPWTVQATGVSASDSPTVTLGGPPIVAPADKRELGRLVTQLEIRAPEAVTRAWRNLALLALGAILLYAALWRRSGRPGLALVAAGALPACYGLLVVYRDRWMEAVCWTLPLAAGALLLVQWRDSARLPAPGARWSAGLAVVALTAGLLLLAQGYMNAFDSDRMYQVAAGLGEYGLPTRYPGHETWTKYGFGLPLLAVPFYFLGKLATLAGAVYEPATRFAVSLTNLPLLALTAWVLYRAGRRFAGPSVALAVVATYLLATPALNYGRTFFSEPAGALFLLAATLLLVPRAGEAAPSERRILIAGALLGGMALLKPALAIHLAPAGLAVLAMGWGAGIRPLLQRAALFAVGPLLAGVAQVGYNYLRYQGLPNALFRTGYEHEPGFSTPLDVGLAGLLFSPGKSLFLYAPALLLAPVGLWLLARSAGRPGRVAATLILAQAALSLVFNGMWWAWTGNFAWGPRLIFPVLPLLIWPLAALGARIVRLPLRRAAPLAGAWAALAAAGAIVSIPGALTDFQVYYHLHELYLAEDALTGPTVYDLGDSPLLAPLDYLRHGLTAAIYRPSLASIGLPRAWDVIIPAVLTLIAAGGAWLAAGALPAARGPARTEAGDPAQGMAAPPMEAGAGSRAL